MGDLFPRSAYPILLCNFSLAGLDTVVFLQKIDCGAQTASLGPSNAIQTSSKLKQGFGNAGEMYCRRLRVLPSSIEFRNVWPLALAPFLV